MANGLPWGYQSNLNIIDQALTEIAATHANDSESWVMDIKAGRVEVCRGEGNVLSNYGRWYQRCTDGVGCGEYLWHNDPTNANDIPEEIQLRFSLRKSADESNVHILCQVPNCRSASGQPRQANKHCERAPQQCASCCKTAGGCRKHKITGATTLTSMAAHSSTQSQSAPNQTSSGSQGEIRSTYARPLDDSYGNPYTVAHEEREANDRREVQRQRVLQNRRNTVIVVIWGKPDQKPAVLNVISHNPNILVPGNHPRIVSHFKDSSTSLEPIIQVFHILPRLDWISQTLDVPVDIIVGGRALIRSQNVALENCPTIDDEIASLLRAQLYQQPVYGSSVGPHPTSSPHIQSTPGSAHIHGGSSSLTSVSSAIAIAPSLASTSNSRPRAKAPVPFPPRYTCDAAAGFFPMLKADTSTVALAAASFSENFPGCRFNKSTYYKHRAYFDDAEKAGILKDFIEYGKSDEGKWSKLTKVVNSIRPTLEQYQASEVNKGKLKEEASMNIEEGRDDSESEDLDNYILRDLQIEEYHMQDGELGSILTSFSTNVQYREAPVLLGACKAIYMFISHVNRSSTIFAAKIYTLPGAWWEPCPNRELYIWQEGAKMARCHLYHLEFKQLAREMESNLAQAWTSGIRFDTGKLTGLDGMTLASFTHYLYEFMGDQSVMTDFQGHHTADGSLKIFNCTLHTTNTNKSNDDFLLGNMKDQGIQAFKAQHFCSEICIKLGLQSFL
ncbi:hypothetical protein M413DRAFT_408415 [Hebeloma cylindrosporum]|uniref:Alpha-type protein kinase domain-containing protein n=1 Tax=Hebeloma cylindrosporum TaxID=76867 RepID=A0A0C2XY01_HEBCY|nr:hypothetical protein M413DRAFT_408415 [Hebeloma cylindrosporum h7]